MNEWIWGGLALLLLAMAAVFVLRRRGATKSADILDELARASALMDKHKLPAARRLLEDLLRRQPSNREVLRLRYQAWKYDPDADQFHRAAHDLLDDPVNDPDANERIFRDYSDYVAVTQGRPRLNQQFYLDLARRFAAAGHIDEASRMVQRVLRKDKSHHALPSTLLAVGRAYIGKGEQKRGRDILENLVALYPDSAHSTTAREILPDL